MNQQNAPLLN